jgi:Tfp pilus assembly pilus retraction ATPase PilT
MSLLNDILRTAFENKASDVHMNVGLPPLFRIHTVLKASDFPIMTSEGIQRLLKEMVNEKRIAGFEELRDADFSYEIPGVGDSASTRTISATQWRCPSERLMTRFGRSRSCSCRRSCTS